jgi:hypothetical protein
MSDKVENLIDTITKENKIPVTFNQMFQSLWGLISVGIGAIGIFVLVTTWIFNTFPTNLDIKEKYIVKQEYYTKLRETKEPIDKEIDSLKIELEKVKKQYESDVRKLRLEYRVERMHDLGQQLKLIDEKLNHAQDDLALKNYREALWKEYNKIRSKIDDGVKEIE